MEYAETAGLRQTVQRRRSANALVLTAAFAFAVTAQLGAAADHTDGKRNPHAKAQIEALMSCYAYASDGLSRAINAVEDTPEMNARISKNFAEALALYRKCSTDDWAVSVVYVLPGIPQNDDFSPDNDVVIDLLQGTEIPPGESPVALVGADQFATAVNGVARGNGEQDAQHLFGSISSTVDGNRGTLRAYGIIHFTHLENSELGGKVRILAFEYNSEVVRQRGQWLLDKTILRLSSASVVDGS